MKKLIFEVPEPISWSKWHLIPKILLKKSIFYILSKMSKMSSGIFFRIPWPILCRKNHFFLLKTKFLFNFIRGGWGWGGWGWGGDGGGWGGASLRPTGQILGQLDWLPAASNNQQPTTNNNPQPTTTLVRAWTTIPEEIQTSSIHGSKLQDHIYNSIWVSWFFEGPNTRLYRFKGQHKGVQIFKFWVFQGLTQ